MEAEEFEEMESVRRPAARTRSRVLDRGGFDRFRDKEAVDGFRDTEAVLDGWG